MQLQSLRIEGFRSLKSVTWKPGRLNVLIGPNGGGKSNLLRALDLIRVAAKGELRETILRMGGMAPLVWDGEAKTISLEFILAGAPSASIYECQFELHRIGNTGSYVVQNDQLSILEAGAKPESARVMLRPRPEDSVVPDWIPPKGPVRVAELLERVGLGDSEAGISLRSAGDLNRAALGWCVYTDLRTDQKAELRQAAVTRSETRVASDGQNLVAVLHTLYTGDRGFEEFLDNAMTAAFPGDYDKLTFTPAEDGRVQMRVRRKHRNKADSTADLSDGTLRFLLLVAILGSPDPAPLIAIDEPETGLHPRMLPIVAELAENAAMKTQVIFSTHSPEFLNAFRDEPPTTTVVTSDGSESELKTLEGESLKRWIDDYSLGKFAFSGEAELAS